MIKWEKINYPWCSRNECKDCKTVNCMELFEEFVKYFKFDRMALPSFVGDYGRLLNGKRTYNNVKCEYGTHYRITDKIPDDDHGRLFKRQGTSQIVYVNQPYGFDREKLEKWCNERDLIYVICERKYSFYYPENTDMILIMSNDTYIKFCDLEGFPWKWE